MLRRWSSARTPPHPRMLLRGLLPPRLTRARAVLQLKAMLTAKFGRDFAAAAAELRPDCGVDPRVGTHRERPTRLFARNQFKGPSTWTLHEPTSLVTGIPSLARSSRAVGTLSASPVGRCLPVAFTHAAGPVLVGILADRTDGRRTWTSEPIFDTPPSLTL